MQTVLPHCREEIKWEQPRFKNNHNYKKNNNAEINDNNNDKEADNNYKEDDNNIEFLQQKSRGYKRRQRSGNSSRNSTLIKPSPKKANLDMSKQFSPQEAILEEAMRLSTTAYNDEDRDQEGDG